jgi:hypothetical protein
VSTYEWTSGSYATINSPARYYLAKFTKIRKRVALMRQGPNVIQAVAYFTSEENARRYCEEIGLEITEWCCCDHES